MKATIIGASIFFLLYILVNHWRLLSGESLMRKVIDVLGSAVVGSLIVGFIIFACNAAGLAVLFMIGG